MKLSGRSVIIWTVLAGTVAAAVFAPQSPSSEAIVGVAESAAAKPAGAARAKVDPDVVLELKPRDTRDLPIDSFSSTLWPVAAPAPAPAAAVPVAEAPPAPVTAPPLPFRVLGRYIESGRATVFMQYNEKTVIATEGTLINDQYRVETINDKAMALTYLPLNERQILMLVSAP